MNPNTPDSDIMDQDILDCVPADQGILDCVPADQDILDYVPTGLFILDQGLSVRFWNACMEDWTGIDREEIIGKSVSEFFPELLEKKYLRRLECIFQGGPPAVFSSQLHPHLIPSNLPNGRLRIQHTTAMAYPTGNETEYWALFAVQDVTDLSDAIHKQQIEHRKLLAEVQERIRTERALRRSERNLAKAQAITRVGSWSVDAKTGKTTCSDQIFKILDVDKNASDGGFGMVFAKAIHETDAETIREAGRKALEEGAKPAPLEYDIRVGDNETRTLILEIEPVIDEDGAVLEAVGTVRDVTAARKAERERLRLEEKIQHAQRLESLTRLAGGIAHDFNNILMGVLGYTSLILSEASIPDHVREFAEMIELSAQRAADLSHQMLAYTGCGFLSMETLNLTRMVENIKPLIEASVPEKVRLAYDLDYRILPVKADPAKVKQVLMNFVTNASEAMTNGSGTIAISNGTEYCDGAVFSETFPDVGPRTGSFSYIEVSDNGCGMDAETRKKIFDPFFTTKFPGRGLGLAASIGIIRGHSGAVSVKSKPSEGTTIRAYFPVVENVLEEGRTKEEERPGFEFQDSRTVLLIDDEEVVRNVGKSLLSTLGLKTLTAESGEEGVLLFKNMSEHIDLCIVDLTMPGMNGEDVFHEIRKAEKNAKVVLSSAYNAEDILEKLSEKGLAGFLRKPYKLSTLRDELRRIIPNG